MIAYIKGKVIDEFDGGVVLENNGIGFEIFCSSSAFIRLTRDKEGGVYTYFKSSDDGITLFGFDTKAEKNMFIKLISVSGVGPKLGISILSGMDLEKLVTAIATSDVKSLSGIKGLGKKTAERIILELRESVSGDSAPITVDGSICSMKLNSEDEDAIMALTSLGFGVQESRDAVKQAKLNGAKTVQEVISLALRSIH